MKEKIENLDGEFVVEEFDHDKWDAASAEIDDNPQTFRDWIDETELDPRLKNLLKKLIDASVSIGTKVYAVGKHILSWIIKYSTTFPKSALGAVVGFVLGLFVSTIPFIGPLLSSFITPITTLIGASVGLGLDVLDAVQRTAIKQAINEAYHGG